MSGRADSVIVFHAREREHKEVGVPYDTPNKKGIGYHHNSIALFCSPLFRSSRVARNFDLGISPLDDLCFFHRDLHTVHGSFVIISRPASLWRPNPNATEN